MNPNEVRSLESLIREQYKNIVGLTVLKNGRSTYEYHADGYNKDTAVHVASVTKSVLSALIGIAVSKGLVNSIDDNVIDYFPFYKLKRGEVKIREVTIRNLLTMTAPYKYKYEPYTKVYSSDDWVTSTLDLLGGKGAIGDFKYTTVGLQVLSGIICSATNQSVREFANENLFVPLGIEIAQDINIRGKEEHFSFLKGDVSSGWVIDPNGVHTAGWGLTLTARDMAKIGQLYLNNGVYQNREVIPSSWVSDSVTAHSQWGDRSYGFLWWVISERSGTYAAIGDSGNVIYVSSEKQLVVSIASRFMPSAKDRIEFIKKSIEPLC